MTDAMDADDGGTKFTNPISDEMDADELPEVDPTADPEEDAGEEQEDEEIDEATGKKRPKAKVKTGEYKAPVQEDLLGDLDNAVNDVDMDPLSLLMGCLKRWGGMSCGERVSEVKNVRNPHPRCTPLTVNRAHAAARSRTPTSSANPCCCL